MIFKKKQSTNVFIKKFITGKLRTGKKNNFPKRKWEKNMLECYLMNYLGGGSAENKFFKTKSRWRIKNLNASSSKYGKFNRGFPSKF